MAERKTIYIDQKLGRGAENSCYVSEEADGSKSVFKVPTWFGRLWQTQGREFLERCSTAIQSLPIKALQAQIHENIELVSTHRFKIRKADTVIEQEYVGDLEDKTLDYGDLLDPESGPEIMETLMEILHKAEEIKESEQLGLDLYGGAIIPEMLGGIFRRITLLILDRIPGVGEKIDGVRGQVRNTILQDGEIVLTDNGLFDLSKSGKIRRLVLTAYNICIAGSIRLLERVNEKHQQTIDPARIKQIPYSGSKFEKWLGEFLLETVMLPLYERHENKSRTNTQALSNTLLIS